MSMNKYCKKCQEITFHFYQVKGQFVNDLCSVCKHTEFSIQERKF